MSGAKAWPGPEAGSKEAAGEGPKVVAGDSLAPTTLDCPHVYFQTAVCSGRGGWYTVLMALAQYCGGCGDEGGIGPGAGHHGKNW